MKLKHLEMTLQRLAGFTRPQAALEQYQTPAPLAARLLYHALMKGDIEGKTVLDLGCGTGILAIGAALLGAASVTGVDIDEKALTIARENADLLDAEITFLAADVREAGCRERIGAYSIFNAGSIPFVEAYTAQKAEVTEKIGGAFPVKRTFAFHTRDVQEIEVEILRLKRTP
jgi:putative methylase